jgi:hypothetical protein
MFLRAQFTGPAFRDLLRFRTASAARPCPQLYFEPSKIFITKVEFLEIAEIFSGPPRSVNYPNNGPTEQVFQATRLGMKLKFKIAASQLNNTNDPVPLAEREGIANVALDLKVENGKDYLTLEVLETDFDSILSLAGAGKQEVSSFISAGKMELGLLERLSILAKDLGGFAAVRHVDLGYNIGLDRVELRAEIGSGPPLPEDVAQWTQFYGNAMDSIVGGGAWALFADQRLGSSLATRVLTKEIDASGKFAREGNVNVGWDGGFPGYHANVEGELIDACWCVWAEIDLDMRLYADVKFSLSNNRLAVDVWLDYKVTDAAEAACCVISAVALFPVVGLYMAFKGDIAWYEYLAGMVLYPSPVLLLAAAIAKFSSSPKSIPTQICVPDPNDEKHFHCELELPSLTEAASCQGAKMTIRADALTGRADGLVLGGPIEMSPLLDPGIGVEVLLPFQYKAPSYACSGGVRSPERFEAELRVFRASGNYDFRLCQVHVLGPFKYAAKLEISSMKCPYSAWVKITIGFQQYDYKPLKVLVATTHGAFHTTIPPAERISDEDREAANMQAIFDRINNCYAKSKRWDFRWLIDPAPYINVVRTRQIWTVVGVASADTRRVDIMDESNAPIAMVDTTVGRAFRITVVNGTRAVSVHQEVGIETERLEDAAVQGVQTLAAVEREFEFETPVVGVDAVRMSPVRTVIVHEKERMTIFSVDENGDLLISGKLDTAETDWVGRIGSTVYAGRPDGEMLLFDLDMKAGVRWIEKQKSAEAMDPGGCGCGGAAAKMSNVPEKQQQFASPDAGQFDYLVSKSAYRRAQVPGGVRILNGFWTADLDGVLVSAPLYRPLKRGAVVRVEDAAGSMLARIRDGSFIAVGEGRRRIELLRALERREV